MSAAPFPAPVETPCILVCQLDLESGLCAGCGRSREEIARWSRYTPDHRREVMAALPARMEAVFGEGPRLSE